MSLSQLRASLRRHTAHLRHRTALAKRSAAMVAKRSKQIKALAHRDRPRATAVKWALAQAAKGIHEVPSGSNRGPGITDWQTAFGAWLVGLAWCGVFVGTALKLAGVKVTARVASVQAIHVDAKAGRNGWLKVVPVASALPGDVVTLFGDAHVELVERVDTARHIVFTVGGNTSPGSGGSQSNGGGVYRRVRPFSAVTACCRPAYPSTRD